MHASPLIVAVLGLNCSSRRPQIRAEIRAELAEAARVPPSAVQVWCNPSRASMVRNVARTFYGARPRGGRSFVRDVTGSVVSALNAGRHVLLFGISYGGSVAARVGELLQTHPLAGDRLHVATFGTIYAPPLVHVDSVHFLHPLDVALRTTGLRAPLAAARGPVFDPYTGVFWHSAAAARPRIFSRASWDAHNAYWPDLLALLRVRDFRAAADQLARR